MNLENQIICADAVEVMRQMPDECVDMIMTDPPYGTNLNNGDLQSKLHVILSEGRRGAPRPIFNDGKEATPLFERVVAESKRVLKRGAVMCVCVSGGGGMPAPIYALWSLILCRYLHFIQMVIWDKGKIGLGWRYRTSYECILVASKGTPFAWYDKTLTVENIIRSYELGIPKIIPSANQHPSEKPEKLAEFFLRLHSKEGDLVFDPFCGSGSFLSCAKKMNRRYFGIDLEPSYVEMSIRRLREASAPLIQSQLSATEIGLNQQKLYGDD